ncbi:hypothetical protein HZS_643 [Henneguya salminicola]|nr:hypothetical protein HZS_643 [Henneguya salminicola]
MANIDQVWKEYCAFEQGVNKASGEKIASDRLRDYNNVKKISKELETMIKGIIRISIPIPPQNTPAEKRQLDLWNKYINWEKCNPLNCEDCYVLSQRVIYAYEQLLQNFSFHTYIWLSATQYIEQFYRKLLSEGDQTRATELSRTCRDIYRRGVNGPMHDNLIIHLCYADFEETFQSYQNSIEVYEKLLTRSDIDKSLTCVQIKGARRL